MRMKLLDHWGEPELKHSAPVSGVAVSPNGRHLLSASLDRTIKLWDARTQKELATLEGHLNGVIRVKFTPDGKCALSSGYDKTLRLWDLVGGKQIRAFEGHHGSPWALALSPDGKYVASGASKEGEVIVWDILTGQEKRRLNGPTSCFSVAFSPDGKHLLCGGEGGYVEGGGPLRPEEAPLKLFDVTTARLLRSFGSRYQVVKSVAIYPDGRFALWDNEKTLEIWDLGGAQAGTLDGHMGTSPGQSVLDIAISPDGTCALSGSHDGGVKLWDLSKQCEILTLEGHASLVHSVAFFPDGKRAVSAGDDQVVKLWDLTTGNTIGGFSGHRSRITCLAVSPKGTRVVTGSRDRTVRLWDVENSREVMVLKAHAGEVNSIAFSPDGTRCISASARPDMTLKVWDLKNGKCLASLTGHHNSVNAVAYLPDGAHVFSGGGADMRYPGGDPSMKLWDLGKGSLARIFGRKKATVVRNYGTGKEWIDSIAVGRINSRPAILANWDELGSQSRGTVKIWGLDGHEIKTLDGHDDSVVAISCSSNGSLALTASRDKLTQLWDLARGEVMQTLEGHEASVLAAVFSPDAKLALTAGQDGTIRLWHLASGIELDRINLRPNFDCATSLAVAPDNRSFFAGTERGVILRYAIPSNLELPAPRTVVKVPKRAEPERANFDTTRLGKDVSGTKLPFNPFAQARERDWSILVHGSWSILAHGTDTKNTSTKMVSYRLVQKVSGNEVTVSESIQMGKMVFNEIVETFETRNNPTCHQFFRICDGELMTDLEISNETFFVSGKAFACKKLSFAIHRHEASYDTVVWLSPEVRGSGEVASVSARREDRERPAKIDESRRGRELIGYGNWNTDPALTTDNLKEVVSGWR